jgi:hypothetical protein
VIIKTSNEKSEALVLCRPAPKAKAPLILADPTKGESFLNDQHCDFCKRKNYSPCFFRKKKSDQMLKWACKACLDTQHPVERWPNFTACDACIKNHQSNHFVLQASKFLGLDFMALDLYNPQYPMAKSPFLMNLFGQKLNGD